MKIYKVKWTSDTGAANGVFPQVFDTELAAEIFADDFEFEHHVQDEGHFFTAEVIEDEN